MWITDLRANTETESRKVVAKNMITNSCANQMADVKKLRLSMEVVQRTNLHQNLGGKEKTSHWRRSDHYAVFNHKKREVLFDEAIYRGFTILDIPNYSFAEAKTI